MLEGFQPRELSLVFAFTSFSYGISQLLYKAGRLKKCEILAGIGAWRRLISGPREREAFDLVAQHLWPEAKNHLHFIQIPTAAARDREPVFRDLDLVPSASSLAESAFPGFSNLTTHGQLGLSQTDHSGVGNMASHISWEDTLIADIVGMNTDYLMLQSHDAFSFASLNQLGSEFFPPPTSSCSGWTPIQGLDDPGPSSSHPPAGGTTDIPVGRGEPPLPIGSALEEVELDETGMFLVVFVFLADITQLVYALAGRNTIPPERHKLYKAEEKHQQDFYKLTRESLFHTLYHYQSLRAPASLALLSVAEKFTK